MRMNTPIHNKNIVTSNGEGWIRTNAVLLPRQAGKTRLPYFARMLVRLRVRLWVFERIRDGINGIRQLGVSKNRNAEHSRQSLVLAGLSALMTFTAFHSK